MHVSVDQSRCTGHGRCYTLAPRVFAPDDQGHAVVVNVEPDGEDAVAARRAEVNCPERAIRLT